MARGGERKQNRWIWKGRVSSILRALIVATLVAVQIFFLIDLAWWLREQTVYFYAIVEVAGLLIILRLVNDNRSDAYKIGWVTLVLILPLSGHLMYLLWGQTKWRQRDIQKLAPLHEEYLSHCDYRDGVPEEYEEQYPKQARLMRYLEAKHFPLYRNNQVTYYSMGEDAFEAIFEDMKLAKRYIFINFFIMAEGSLFDRMREILKQKLAEGVEVLLLYDDFGTMFRVPENTLQGLREDGIRIHVFNPIHKYTGKLYMNYRSHQKIVVIDGETAYTGGINLADEYANIVNRFGVWKDSAIRVRGDVAWSFGRSFLQMWNVTGTAEEAKAFDAYMPNAMFPENKTYCQFFTDGPILEEQSAQYTYQQICESAGRCLYITTPYLILDQQIKQSLCYAAKSGVDVRIITPGIPDKKMVKLLTNYNYGPLLRAGVRIFEYTPGFIHSKVIMNERCACVSTINMDYRSFFLHYEDGVVVSDERCVETIQDDFLHTLEDSREITYSEWMKRPIIWRMIQPILNLYAVLL